MQKVYAIEDAFGDLFQGTWTDKSVADRVLKIIQMAVDDCAKPVSIDVNQWAEQIGAGLLPYKVEIVRSVADGKILEKRINLTWPPSEVEGLIEERDDYVRYFAWARTQGEAIQKAIITTKRSSQTNAPKGATATW